MNTLAEYGDTVRIPGQGIFEHPLGTLIAVLIMAVIAWLIWKYTSRKDKALMLIAATAATASARAGSRSDDTPRSPGDGVVAGAKAGYDTNKAMADWIAAHPFDALQYAKDTGDTAMGQMAQGLIDAGKASGAGGQSGPADAGQVAAGPYSTYSTIATGPLGYNGGNTYRECNE